jgi:hypothetical protein
MKPDFLFFTLMKLLMATGTNPVGFSLLRPTPMKEKISHYTHERKIPSWGNIFSDIIRVVGGAIWTNAA